jgi:hypothetical protein
MSGCGDCGRPPNRSRLAGFGRDAVVSSATGLARQTIRNRRRELAQSNDRPHSPARSGASRHRGRATGHHRRPGLAVRTADARRSMSPLRSTCKSAAKLEDRIAIPGAPPRSPRSDPREPRCHHGDDARTQGWRDTRIRGLRRGAIRDAFVGRGAYASADQSPSNGVRGSRQAVETTRRGNDDTASGHVNFRGSWVRH